MSWSRLVSERARGVLYGLVIHVLQADGRITEDEVSAARGAADALGVDAAPSDGAPRTFESLGLDRLGPLERPLAYAAAVWMAMADRELAISENALLRRTRASLDIPDGLASTIEMMSIEHARRAGEGQMHLLPAEHQVALETLLDRVTATMIA